MKGWPHKDRDLAIANIILAEAAALTAGVLSLLDNYQERPEDEMMTFQFPPWVIALLSAFQILYEAEECLEMVDNVLTEVTKQFKELACEHAELFRKLVLLALRKNTPSLTLH